MVFLTENPKKLYNGNVIVLVASCLIYCAVSGYEGEKRKIIIFAR